MAVLIFFKYKCASVRACVCVCVYKGWGGDMGERGNQ